MSTASTKTNAIVRGIVREYGAQILQNPKRLRALLADYLPGAPQNGVDEVLQKIECSDTDEFLITQESTAENAAGVLEASYKNIAIGITNDLNNAARLADKRKKQLIAAIIIACVSIIGSVKSCVSYNDVLKWGNSLYDDKEKLNTELSSVTSERDTITLERNTITLERDKLKSQVSALQTELAGYKKAVEKTRAVSMMSVNGMKVGNWGKDFWGTWKWLTEPGGRLTANKIQYLSSQITYTGSVNRTLTFFVTIKNPSGTIIKSSNATGNYTYSFPAEVKTGKNNLYTWDSDSGNIYYYPGVWTIELWYDGVQLYSGKVTLY